MANRPPLFTDTQAVRAMPFKLEPDADATVSVTRQLTGVGADLEGFKLKLIDTCGLEDPEAGDTVNYGVRCRALKRSAQPVPLIYVLSRQPSLQMPWCAA